MNDKNLYCYQMMPSRLKNVGATYQRLVNKMFREQIGQNMEVDVDDMLVKSVKVASHVIDLSKAFDTLRCYGMKLNPSKCAFVCHWESSWDLLSKKRNRGQSREDKGSFGDSSSPKHKAVTTTNRENNCIKSVYFQIHRQIPSILQNFEESFFLELSL